MPLKRIGHRLGLLFFMIVVSALGGWPASRVWAAELREIGKSVRALGMGNAYLGIVNDSDMIFYNPAAIARPKGYYWTILDPYFGLNGLDAFQTVTEAQNASSFSDTIRSLFGESVWLGGGAKTAVYLPHFIGAIYDSFDLRMWADNPVNPELHLQVVNDFTYAAGSGFTILPGLDFGFLLRRIQRSGNDAQFDVDTIGDLDTSSIFGSIQNPGVAYAADLGINWTIPGVVAPTFSFVWRNIGDTQFRTTLGADPPPVDQDEMAVGVGMSIDSGLVAVTPAFDFRYLNRPDVQIGKKINFGLEVNLPVVDLRGGYHQGYLTYGLGVSLGLIRLDLASWGEEIGEYAGQHESRRFALQFTLEFGLGSETFDAFKGGQAGSTARSRLKQRR